jgi:hypothetical protein
MVYQTKYQHGKPRQEQKKTIKSQIPSVSSVGHSPISALVPLYHLITVLWILLLELLIECDSEAISTIDILQLCLPEAVWGGGDSSPATAP